MSQQDPKVNKVTYASAILSLNRALLDEVSPALRAAKIRWDDTTIHLYFYYDGEISEEDHESAEDAATVVISDFPGYELEIDIIRLDYPKPIPQGEARPVYHRREPKPLIVE